MKTNFKFTDTPSDDRLRAYAEEKIDAFSKLLHEREVESAMCYVEFKKSTHHHTGDVCSAEVTLEVTGKVYRCVKEEPTFEKAIDKVKDDILASLRADKGRARDFIRRGASMMKRMLRNGE
jgi:ribosome-associated translation inhibitor RaiA